MRASLQEKPEPVSEAFPPPTLLPVPANKEKTILVADPDKLMIQDILGLFKQEKFTFIRALHADDLMEWLKVCSPDILLVSTELPGMGAAELVSVIKLVLPRVPIIVMTGQESMAIETEKHLRKEGIFYLFNKSFGLEELKTAASRALKAGKRIAVRGAADGMDR